MKRKIALGIALLAVMALGWVAAGCAPPLAVAAPVYAREVPLRAELQWAGSYARDIQPVFNEFCVSCHGPENPANGLRLDSYEGVIKGTQYGRVVIPGMPEASTLVRTLQLGVDPQVHMPHGSLRLSANRIQNLALWIAAGSPKN